MFNTVVTVFNHYYSKQFDKYTWYPHVLSGCYFNADKAANVEKTGLKDADAAVLHIPYSFSDGACKIGDLIYMDPIEWQKQPNDSYSELITFADGKDFFVVGEFPEEPIDDSLYSTGGSIGFKDYMMKNHDHVYSINSVGRYKAIPHFELRGS